MSRRPVRLLFALLLAALPSAGGGCIFGGGGNAAPRDRIGALPFPGMFTLYTVADPERLGHHRAGRIGRIPVLQKQEKERGIMYSTRAGFIDLAHIREAIDWTRYDVLQLRKAIKKNRTEVVLKGKNHARLLVILKYPDGWRELPPAERKALGEELAMRAGQQLGYLTLTWHEVITWFGYRKLFMIDEQPSAFTYDDTMSHMVGIRVAARALRDGPKNWNAAVTKALKAELRELNTLRPTQTNLAVHAVENVWWTDGRPLKRQFAPPPVDDGDGISVTPWIVPGFPFDAPPPPAKPFTLPSLYDVRGRDCSKFLSVQIQPNIDETPVLLRHCETRSGLISHQRDLPQLLAAAEQQMRERFGVAVNVPWPDAAGANALATSRPPAAAAGPEAKAPTTTMPSTLPSPAPGVTAAAPPPPPQAAPAQ